MVDSAVPCKKNLQHGFFLHTDVCQLRKYLVLKGFKSGHFVLHTVLKIRHSSQSVIKLCTGVERSLIIWYTKGQQPFSCVVISSLCMCLYHWQTTTESMYSISSL